MEVKALEEISNFLSSDTAYVSVSWGKDSVVIAHLALQFQIPIVHVFDAVTFNPCAFDVRGAFEQEFGGDICSIKTGYRPEARGDGSHEDFFAPVVEKFGPRTILGLRKSESAVRAVSRARHGLSTETRCRPIMDWTNQDVFAYLAWKNLPVSSVYAMSREGGIPRDHLRTDVIGDFNGRGKGRTEWEKIYFPDRMNAIKRESTL